MCVCRHIVEQAQMMLTDADWTMSRLRAQLSAVCVCACVRRMLNHISFIVAAVYPRLHNNWLRVRAGAIRLWPRRGPRPPRLSASPRQSEAAG